MIDEGPPEEWRQEWEEQLESFLQARTYRLGGVLLRYLPYSAVIRAVHPEGARFRLEVTYGFLYWLERSQASWTGQGRLVIPADPDLGVLAGEAVFVGKGEVYRPEAEREPCTG